MDYDDENEQLLMELDLEQQDMERSEADRLEAMHEDRFITTAELKVILGL